MNPRFRFQCYYSFHLQKFNISIIWFLRAIIKISFLQLFPFEKTSFSEIYEIEIRNTQGCLKKNTSRRKLLKSRFQSAGSHLLPNEKCYIPLFLISRNLSIIRWISIYFRIIPLQLKSGYSRKCMFWNFHFPCNFKWKEVLATQ